LKKTITTLKHRFVALSSEAGQSDSSNEYRTLSTFLIDLVKNEKGLLYLEISQIIHNVKEFGRIKLKPAVISDLIKVLREYQSKLPGIKMQALSDTEEWFSTSKAMIAD
jgi:hypothetical protein